MRRNAVCDFFALVEILWKNVWGIQENFVSLRRYNNLKAIIMCTVTLEYNQSNALARRKLAALLATGLFIQEEIKADEPTPEQLQAHRELRDAALEHSRKSMSPIIARYL